MRKVSIVIILLLILSVALYYFLQDVGMNSFEQIDNNQSVERVEQQLPEPQEQYQSVKTGIVLEDELASDNDNAPFPSIWGNYEKYMGFEKYIIEMQKKGCVLFFFSKSENSWRKIDFIKSTIDFFDVSQVGKLFGNKPSRISNENALKKFIASEPVNTEFFLAKPISMENNIENILRDKFTKNGIQIKNIVGIRADYFTSSSKFYLKVVQIIDKDRGTLPFESIIEL